MTFNGYDAPILYQLQIFKFGLILLGYNDGIIGVYDILSGKLIQTLKKHSDCITKIEYDEDNFIV